MAERVGENDGATMVYEVLAGVEACVALIDIGLDDNLVIGKSEILLHLLHRVDEVLVVGRVLIVQTNQTDLDSLCLVFLAASCQRKNCNCAQDEHNDLLHNVAPLLYEIREKPGRFRTDNYAMIIVFFASESQGNIARIGGLIFRNLRRSLKCPPKRPFHWPAPGRNPRCSPLRRPHSASTPEAACCRARPSLPPPLQSFFGKCSS